MARGRKSPYSPEIAAEIVKLLAGGCIIKDTCSKVGIAQSTFFKWVKEHAEFSEQVTRARADANVGATLSLRKAMMPHDVSSHTTKTVTETRLRKVRTEHGISEVPYEWTKTEQSSTVSNEFDWRAALEYLKRRDPENWAEAFIVKVKPEQNDILKEAGIPKEEAFDKFVDLVAVAVKRKMDAMKIMGTLIDELYAEEVSMEKD